MSNIEAGHEPEPLGSPDPLDPRPAATIQGRLRIARGLYTKKEFGERMGGIDPDTICNYEDGKTTRLKPYILAAWAKESPVPGVTLEWLIGDWTVPKGDENGTMSAHPLVIARPSDLMPV